MERLIYQIDLQLDIFNFKLEDLSNMLHIYFSDIIENTKI